MKRRIVKTPEEVLEALPEEVLQGVFEDMAELVERRLARQRQGEVLEARSEPEKRSRRRRTERPDREA